MALVVLAVTCLLVIAAVMDQHDARHGHVRRDPSEMAAERRDLRADLEATQHQGISVPIDNICADRQRRR